MMNLQTKKCLKYVWLVILFAGISCTSPKDHDLVIANVNLIDVETGRVLPHQFIAIDADTITAIYTEGPEFTANTKIVDGNDKYLIPGLWDMHVHHNWNYKDTNPLHIANGIVGVREMWGNMYVHDKIEKGIENGTMDVPEVYTGSIIIDGTPQVWPGSIEVANAEEAREVALEQIESGVDFLKVYSNLSKESFDAIADVANEKGIPFAGHVPESVTIQYAAKKGMVSAEHFYGMSYGSSAHLDSLHTAGAKEGDILPLLLDSFSQEQFDATCKVLVEEELWLSPTLVTNRGYAYRTDPTFVKDERLKYMADYMLGGWFPDTTKLNNPEAKSWIESIQREYNFWRMRVGEMQKKGVRFIAGSDYPNPFCFPGFSLHDEIELFVEGGMSPLAALQTATLNPAIFMEKEAEYGTIATGKKASLVLLEKNPLEEIGNTRTINAVILRGKPFMKADLEAMLEAVLTRKETPSFGTWLRGSIEQNGIEVAMDSLDLLLALKEPPYRLEEMDLNYLGYQLMDKENLENALRVFHKNTLLFPEEFNVYDSYGEVLLMDGQLEKAKENYKKAIEINPYYPNAQVMIDSINAMMKSN